MDAAQSAGCMLREKMRVKQIVLLQFSDLLSLATPLARAAGGYGREPLWQR